MEPIEDQLKKTAAAIRKGSSPNTSSTKAMSTLPGDPNCPVCAGVGYVRLDVPVGDPAFGRLVECECLQRVNNHSRLARLAELSNLDSYQSMTFDTFNPQGRTGLADKQTVSLIHALNQAQHFARARSGWLLLIGGYGCGKTHLAAAVAHAVVAQGVRTLFLTVPDLLDWLRYSYDDPEATYEQRFEEIRNVPFLVLDDLGTQNATSWAQEKLFQIINHRYLTRLPTVVTSNVDMEELDGRMRSRLQDPDLVTVVRIFAPDYRSPTRDTTHPQLSSLHYHSGQLLGNFSLRQSENIPAEERGSLEKAFKASMDFAEHPRGWLVLIGEHGTGKTHLAAAIGNHCQSLGERVLFVVVPDLLDHLRSTFSPSSSVSYDDRFEEVRSIPLLILDDLGTQSATPWAREKLYQIVNHRYSASLPTVITSSYKLEEIDAGIRSRMLDRRLCMIYALQVPPFRTSATGSLEKPRRKSTGKS
jgi:DNA replication protein DnaC